MGHGRKGGNLRESKLRPALLQGSSSCTVCHGLHLTWGRKAKSRTSHALNMGRAHLAASKKSVGSSVRSSRVAFALTGANMDAESHDCLSCHDGTIASDIGRDDHQSHPVGVVHTTRSGDTEMPVKPRQMIDPRIRLLDGRIGCGTCHNAYSREANQLVMSNQGSAFCLSCHGR